MEENPLLPFTLAMTVGVSLAILVRAALSVWRNGDRARRNRQPDPWDADPHPARLLAQRRPQ